jgi:uncharacterized protein YcbX
MRIGTVVELWRHPVKSMGGEPVATAEIGLTGLAGDRHWAVLDGQSKEIRSAKRWPELLRCRARYAADGSVTTADYGSRVQAVILTGPDGRELRSDAPDRDAVLTAWLGRAATLSPRQGMDDTAHYRLARPRTTESIAADIGLQPGESFPVYGDMDAATMDALAESATPPGSYVDAFPLHLISRNALAWFAERSGLDADPRRFRANLVIKVDGAGSVPAEDGFSGHRLAIGDAVLRIDSRTVRCGMPGRAQTHFGLDEQPTMTGALVRQADRRLGVNVLVERPGHIRVGDPIHRLD